MTTSGPILVKEFKGVKYKYAQGKYLPETSLYSINDETDIRERYWNIQKGDYVVDVGAGYGGYTLPALALGAEVIVFEPHKPTYQDLMHNLDVNPEFKRWMAFGKALGAKRETDRILPEGLRPDEKEKRKVDITTLDDMLFVVKEKPPKKVDWIKIDTEGMELEILQGAEKTIRKYKPKILIETHNFIVPHIDLDVMRFIRDLNLGYTTEQIFPWGHDRSIVFSTTNISA